MLLRLRQRVLTFPRRPLVMGIVNINDDSFCGDGTLDVAAAMAHAASLAAQGADIIDAGAESARTNRPPISPAEEIARLAPFIEAFHEWSRDAPTTAAPWDSAQIWPPALSLNTWRPEVAEAVLPLGADILNDISGMPDDRNARLCARHGAALLIMHSVGLPKIAHTHVRYSDIMAELEMFFEDRIRRAIDAGMSREGIILDPGIDFAKQRDDNLRILAECGRLRKFQRPILLPVSRKSVIGHVLGLKNPNDRDAGTVACLTAGMLRGADIFRVHNVAAAAQSVKTLHALAEAPAAHSSETTSAMR
jgi:dihydropteroate synthase